jgi:ABC-type branched-subunit amino acid transport system substrate-binding protein
MDKHPVATSADTIKIGVVTNLAYASDSLRRVYAARLAAEEFNNVGGVNGKRVEILSKGEDFGIDINAVQGGIPRGTQLLVDQGALVIVGLPSSAYTSLAYTNLTGPSHHKIPIVAFNAVATSLTALDTDTGTLAGTDLGYLWRVCPSDGLQGTVLAEQIYTVQGIHTMGIIWRNEIYGQGLHDAFRARYQSLGGTIISASDVSYDPTTTDFTTQVDTLFSGNPAGVLLISFQTDAAYIVNTMKAYKDAHPGFTVPRLFGGSGVMDQAFLDLANASMTPGMMGTDTRGGSDNPNKIKFANAFTARTGLPLANVNEDRIYDCVYLICLALARGHANTSLAIIDNLRQVSGPTGTVVNVGEAAQGMQLVSAGTEVNYEGASGNCDFDAYGDVRTPYQWWTVNSTGTGFTTIPIP